MLKNVKGVFVKYFILELQVEAKQLMLVKLKYAATIETLISAVDLSGESLTNFSLHSVLYTELT